MIALMLPFILAAAPAQATPAPRIPAGAVALSGDDRGGNDHYSHKPWDRSGQAPDEDR
jgi:hypothetical protein